MFQRVCFLAWLAVALLVPGVARATETENHVLRLLPAPGAVAVDGKADDWDLSGGVFVCGDVERFRDQYAVWFHGMHDAKNVYFLARWLDPTPLNNEESAKGGHGFHGDCLQVRFIAGYQTDQEVITWLTCWRDRDGISVIDRASPGERDSKRPGKRLPNLPDALAHGARQAFVVNADGKSYVQEIAIPWTMLTADGTPPAGSQVRIAVEPNYTAGPSGRISLKDLFREGIVVDRVFTFRAYDQWGTGVLEKTGRVTPRPVRLADGREFAVKLEKGTPVIDWTGLIRPRVLPGFKSIALDVPFDGFVSLNLRDRDGTVVRHLLTGHPFGKGRHEVKWDGLATPTFRTPGQPLPAGEYTWEAVAYPGLKVRLRGWAASAGQYPWAAGPGTGWGGDHGTPDACAADGNHVYLGWNGAEAGRAVVACDPDGRVRWRIGTGIGEASEHLAADGGIVVSLGHANGLNGRQLVRMRASDGVFDNWEGRPSAALEIPALWEGRTDAAALPEHADGMDVKNGTLYLTFAVGSFDSRDVLDWKELATKALADTPLGARLRAPLDAAERKRLANFVAGKLKPQQALNGPPSERIDRPLVRALNELVKVDDLVPGTGKRAAGARAEANRRHLEKEMAGALRTIRSNFVAVCDAKTARVRKLIDLPYPRAVRAVSDTLVYVISDASTVLALNPQTGTSKPVVSGLRNAVSLAVGADGKLYVGLGEPDHQVKVFAPDGTAAGVIGRPGGRRRIGPWQPDGLFAIAGMAVDARGRLWVAESDRTPKRVSVWDAAGKLAAEHFGPTQYGASGATIHPDDPNVMISEGCEWRLDPATGRARCTGVVDTHVHHFAVFCAPNGRQYLATVRRVETSTRDGRYARVHPLEVFERVGEGDYRLRAAVWPDADRTCCEFWADADGNGKRDDGETLTVPDGLEFSGNNAWSLSLNPADFTLYVTSAAKQAIFRIPLAGFTACNAPRWDVSAMKPLPIPWTRAVAGMLPDFTNRRLVLCEADRAFRCFDLTTGKERWAYPNPFFSVHGSHKAPPAEPGLIRGAYGLIGTAWVAGLGTVWCINTNVGEWHLLSDDGFYVGRLFQPDPMKVRFPETATPGADLTEAPPGSGGEDFGGVLVQGRDGRVYVQTGKTAAWNTEVIGLAAVKKIASGTVRLDPADLPLARAEHDRQMQAAAGTRLAEIKRLTPKLTGVPSKDFAGIQPLRYQKQDDAAVKTWTAWDGDALYLAYEVADPTPWVNGASEPAQMYVSGDTVDFQFATDPKADPRRAEAVAGDFRLSVGNFRGQPTAVLYRKVSAQKQPKAFSSGVVPHYEMEFVGVLSDVRVVVKPARDGKGYALEVALPWKALGFTPVADRKYRGDFGVTHGDPAGSRTRLRTHWNNQETGLVDDAVFELKMVPRNWGEIVFRQ